MARNNRTKILGAFATGLFVGLLVSYTVSGQWGKLLGSSGKSAAVTLPPPALSLLDAAEEIKKGGYILYFRHGNRAKWDSVIAFDVFEMVTGSNSPQASFSHGVCLSAQGREEAKMIGKIFQLAKVQVGAVVSSPSCRAKQTAQLAFGRIDFFSNGLAHTPVTNTANAPVFRSELRRVLVSVPIEAGKNVVIAAHGNTLENHADLFVEGAEIIRAGLLSETGFYMIKRDQDGSLRVIQRFQDLGVFAANAITLNAHARGQ